MIKSILAVTVAITSIATTVAATSAQQAIVIPGPAPARITEADADKVAIMNAKIAGRNLAINNSMFTFDDPSRRGIMVHSTQIDNHYTVAYDQDIKCQTVGSFRQCSVLTYASGDYSQVGPNGLVAIKADGTSSDRMHIPNGVVTTATAIFNSSLMDEVMKNSLHQASELRGYANFKISQLRYQLNSPLVTSVGTQYGDPYSACGIDRSIYNFHGYTVGQPKNTGRNKTVQWVQDGSSPTGWSVRVENTTNTEAPLVFSFQRRSDWEYLNLECAQGAKVTSTDGLVRFNQLPLTR